MVNIEELAILGELLGKGERDNREMTDHHRVDRHSMFRLKQIGALLSSGRLGTNRQVPIKQRSRRLEFRRGPGRSKGREPDAGVRKADRAKA